MAKKAKPGGRAVKAEVNAAAEDEQEKKSNFVLIFLPFVLALTSFGLLALYWLR